MNTSNLIKTIESLGRKRFTSGLTDDIISSAESQLSLTFAMDYKIILKQYGGLFIKGTEILGIDNGTRDVVKETIDARHQHSSFPTDAYVIENMGIDGILLVQKKDGKIYTFQHNSPLQLAYSSLEEYFKSL